MSKGHPRAGGWLPHSLALVPAEARRDAVQPRASLPCACLPACLPAAGRGSMWCCPVCIGDGARYPTVHGRADGHTAGRRGGEPMVVGDDGEGCRWAARKSGFGGVWLAGWLAAFQMALLLSCWCRADADALEGEIFAFDAGRVRRASRVDEAFSLPAAATWATAGSGSGSGSGCSRNPHPLGPSIPSAKLLTEQRRRRGRQTQFDQFGTASAQASHPPLHMLTPVAGVAAGKLQEGIDGCHRLPYLQSSPTVTSPQAQPMLPLV
ncbi:hypothetical protein IWX50DRAFT_616631 [Phyllosticta citricarpa]